MGFSSKEGDFVNEEGNILGRHKGILHYTVGQRKGLGIALGKPVFVTSIDPEKNRVVLGTTTNCLTKKVVCEDYFFTAGSPKRFEGKKLYAKVRYSAKPAAVSYEVYDKKLLLLLTSPREL